MADVNRRWSLEEIETIRARNYNSLEFLIGLAAEQLRRVVQDHALELYEAGLDITEIASRLGTSRTQALIYLIVPLVERGDTDEEIAAQLSLSVNSIKHLRASYRIRRPDRSRRWTLEKIAAMRQEIVEEGKTLQEIGEREGVSRERIRQLVGNVDEEKSARRKALRSEQVKRLFDAGLSDEQIIAQTGIPKTAVKKHRSASGLRRPNPNQKWTPEKLIEFAQWWFNEFGSLAVSDWCPPMARKLGHQERIDRFYELGAPNLTTVTRCFGSFSEMKRQAGLPASKRGFNAIGLHSDAPKRVGTWRPTTPDGGWNQESIIVKALEWEERFGEEPRPCDWGTNQFTGSRGTERRARYEELGAPNYTTVKKYFGSFRTMLEEARKRKNSS